jgi:hypothetical protein
MNIVRAPVQLLMFFAAREEICQESKMLEFFPTTFFHFLWVSEHLHDGWKSFETRDPSRRISSSSSWLAGLPAAN